MKTVISTAALLLLSSFVNGDLYMQGIRGSNNRLDERGRDRANGNRLFDSQNNDRGGYNVGKVSYYVGEKVPVTWSNQHGSSIYQMYGTEFSIQYACGTKMRDGTSTNTIPDRPTQCANYDCDTDVEYGMHESWTDYQYCKATSRNKGLFTANQNLRNRHAAIYTRQNPNGNRRGYECPEERDYYPYWRPSIWRDIAIYTNQPARCPSYVAETQNVKDRYQCTYDNAYWEEVLEGYVEKANGDLPITQEECNNAPNYTVPSTNETRSMYSWINYGNFGIDPPDCITSSATRANHHGTIGGRSYYTYDWTVPDYINSASDTCCVLRMRYNITTNDYQAWASDSSVHAGLDYRNNSLDSSPNPDNDPAWVKIWENFRLSYDDIYQSFDGDRDGNPQQKSRGYVFINNPRVDPFGELYNASDGTGYRVQLQLAINTNQFGRTFQDRTHCFQILERPDTIPDTATISLLTVQGKRGNIVQVYPATEYFFIPEPLQVSPGSYVHFCWTGSNTNPDNNDGQGRQGTDRSNICPLTQQQYPKTYYSVVDGNDAEFAAGAVGDLGNNYPDYVQTPDYGLPDYYNYANKRAVSSPLMAGFSQEIINELCTQREIGSNDLMDYGNMEELDDAGTTFCIPPVEVTASGTFNYLSTRNNNFSNRSQKGIMIAGEVTTQTFTVSTSGLSQDGETGAANVIVLSSMVNEGDTLEFQVTTWKNTGEESTIVEVSGVDGGDFSADTLVDGGWIQLWVPYTPKSISQPYAYRKATEDDDWVQHSQASIKYDEPTDTYYGVVNIQDGGFYKIQNEVDWGILVLFVVAVAIGAICLGVVIFNKCCSK